MNQKSDGKIGLTLSGGGFRATLFHLGVVSAFRQLGRLVDVSVVSCVSGGSIIGAHLVLNWEQYISAKEEDFEHVARELVAITTKDIRGRIIRRLPLKRHHLFEYYLDRYLFSRALLTAIENPKLPTLILNTTDLKHGRAAAFIGANFLPDVRRPYLDDGTFSGIDVGPFSLAAAVACSAAFPALFPERELSAKDFAQPRKKWEFGASLSDGGVYDNLGLQVFLGTSGIFNPAMFYVSDAGAPFDYTAGLSGNILSRVARVTDVQMNLLRTAFIEDAESTPVSIQQISITDEPSTTHRQEKAATLQGIPPREIVRRLQLVRTDLDDFTDVEIDLLIRHGYTVAYKVLTGSLDVTSKIHAVWSPIQLAVPATGSTIQQQSAQLEKSQRRRLGLFNPHDKLFPVPWLLIAFAIFLLFAAVEVLRPFLVEYVRSPRVDRVITGRPYRLTRVMRYIVLEPAPERSGHQGVVATSRFFYWARLNENITAKDSTFTETLTPTYNRSEGVHGLGVIGANAIRESEGTLPFDARQELVFDGKPGETLLLGTGIQYEFDWPGSLRSLEGTHFNSNEDYWAYENTVDYVDSLVLVVESHSDKLLVGQTSDCATLYRANQKIETTKCSLGENNGKILRGLPKYGGALVAYFHDLKPGDEAIIKYSLDWR